MNENLIVHTERVDDVPLLLAQMQRMELPTILDACFPPHGNREGLSLGWLCTVWLAHILSRADHRLNRVRPWAEQLRTTLNSALPQALGPTDLTDDRLADALRALSHDQRWQECERALNQHTLRVYHLTPATVRLDSTSASGYWQVTDTGLFQFGHSKDHRPDLPQLKLMLATLDPLGMPLAVDVVAGQHNDDPLYLPVIKRVRKDLAQSGLLYVGDCKLGALATRAALHHNQDYYLCPLSAVQLPAEQLAALVEIALAAPEALCRITRLDDTGQAQLIAEASETSMLLSAQVEDVPITWQERRVLVRSCRAQAAQIKALYGRVAAAEQALAKLLIGGRGRVRPTTPQETEAAVLAIVERYAVSGLVEVRVDSVAHTRTLRPYRERQARTETTYELALWVERNDQALARAEARLGWRVYATNKPVEQFSMEQVVLAYRDEYLIERAFSRLKGTPLSLSPVYLSRDDHTVGLVRLLSVGLRVLMVLEHAVRSKLAEEVSQARVSGLYAGQPNRVTTRPSAERVLEAFDNLTLTTIELPGQVIRHLAPLSALQQRLLALAGLDVTCYLRLSQHLSEPPG